MENWRVFPFGYYSAFENMALDEALFRVLQERGGPPVLRFYGWGNPTLSLGYFQNAAKEINLEHCRDNNVDIVRRPTGGKAVLHDRDLTYSVISRESPPLFSNNLIDNYRTICTCLIRGLADLGIPVKMAEEKVPPDDQKMEAICFAYPASFELLSRGRKICGSAQVRSRGCFLQHGSVALDFNPLKNSLCFLPSVKDANERCTYLENKVTSVRGETGVYVDPEMLSEVLQKAFEAQWRVYLVPSGLTAEEEEMKQNLLMQKYTRPSWNREGKA